MNKDWRERELTIEVIVGAFVALVLLGLGYFTIILSKEAWFSDKIEMKVGFHDVMGLSRGDTVEVRGMPIGQVKDLKLVDSDQCVGVCVTLSLDSKVTMREGYKIKIISTSILGGRQLHIDEGPCGAPPIELDMYKGQEPYDLMEDAAEIVSAARNEIISGKVFENVRNIADQINDMVTRVNKGQGLLGALMTDDAPLSKDIAESMSSVRHIVTRVDKGEGLLGEIVTDNSQLQQDIDASMASIRKVAGRIENGKGTVGMLVNDSTLYDDLTDAVASFKNIGESISNGQGTVGKLVKDDKLYNDVEATVGELRATIDDFRETAPITAFSSVFFGAF